MIETEYLSLMGQLLRDPAIRSKFASDRSAFLASVNASPEVKEWLDCADTDALEYQAKTLIGKRFSLVRAHLPDTLDRLGSNASPLFEEYASRSWPEPSDPEYLDSLAFYRFASSHFPRLVSSLERNRLEIQQRGTRFRIHLAKDFPHQGLRRYGFQVLIQPRRGTLIERWLRVG